MTISIRTTCGDIFLTDTIGSYYWEAFENAPDTDACMDAVRDFIIDSVNDNLPERLTWFPYISEVYVDLDADYDDDEEIDDREVDDIINDLITDAFAKVDDMLESDPDAFGRTTPLTDYEKLLAAATASDADQDDINALGEWLNANDSDAWNGEYYDADGLHLFPLIEWNDETDQGETVGYEIR